MLNTFSNPRVNANIKNLKINREFLKKIKSFTKSKSPLSKAYFKNRKNKVL